MLDAFFTNKIPSSHPDWTDELILVASIFNRFDGRPYDRSEITDEFEIISHRVTGTRDASDYRDEYGAYASFLGLLHYEAQPTFWASRVSLNAKRMLCGPYPDPRSFVRLQMALLQYPNPIGAVYAANGHIHLEPHSHRKRTQQVRQGVRTVPFRLILRTLLALNAIQGQAAAHLTYAEIWHCLFSAPPAFGTPDPDGDAIARCVIRFRANPNEQYNLAALRNLHILQHTGLVIKPRNQSRIILAPGAADSSDPLGIMAQTVAEMTGFFPTPAADATDNEIRDWAMNALASGQWAEHFTGSSMPAATTTAISEPEMEPEYVVGPAGVAPSGPLVPIETEKRQRQARMQQRVTNPEETQVMRERANLAHRTIIDVLVGRMRAAGMNPVANQFIDVACATDPRAMIFEAKSCNPSNLLNQVRKGVSQLYEYRYRHPALQGAKLVLALEFQPDNGLEWLIDYLVGDREIDLLWLEGDMNLACPSSCRDSLANLVNRIHSIGA